LWEFGTNVLRILRTNRLRPWGLRRRSSNQVTWSPVAAGALRPAPQPPRSPWLVIDTSLATDRAAEDPPWPPRREGARTAPSGRQNAECGITADPATALAGAGGTSPESPHPPGPERVAAARAGPAPVRWLLVMLRAALSYPLQRDYGFLQRHRCRNRRATRS
jgi:hypothetical protein